MNDRHHAPADPADRLLDNIVRRNERDLILNGFATALVLVAPLATLLVLTVLIGIDGTRASELEGYISIVVGSILVMETLIAMHMARTMYTRLSDHSERDAEWRDAVIGYVSSIGSDASKLESIDAPMRRRERFRSGWPLKLVFFTSAVFDIAMLAYAIPSEDGIARAALIAAAVAWGCASCIITFMMIAPGSLLFAYKHERDQSSFTEALSKMLSRKGIHIRPMARVVKSNKIPLHIFLLFPTLGAWSLYLLFKMFRSMNDHLMNQWMYEEELVTAIRTGGGAGFDKEMYRLRQEDEGIKFSRRQYRAESKASARRANRMPLPLVAAELFLLVVCANYILNIIGLACDLSIHCDAGGGMFAEFSESISGGSPDWIMLFAPLQKMGMIAIDMALLMLTIGSLLGIASRRLSSWRKVTRCCVTFTVPLFLNMMVGSDSFTRLFTLDPFATAAVLSGMMLLMILSGSIRRFYAPVGAEMPPLRSWVAYILWGSLESSAHAPLPEDDLFPE